MASTVTEVDTPQGPGRLYVDPAEQPSSLLVLGHGAGGGVSAADLELLATSLPALGTTVVRFEQPWRTAGRTAGAAPPKLDEAWRAALGWLVEQEWAQHPLLVGGRSAGARVACRTASETNPAAIVCLAFPLHLPGRPGEVPDRGAVSSQRAQIGPARQQGQLRHSAGDPHCHRHRRRHQASGAAGSRSRLPDRAPAC